jgi:F0F1-type ATP synthase assembly protein I
VNLKKNDPGRYALNMTLAAVAGQVGCLTLVIILVAALGGLWLDNVFGTKPLFTIGLLLVSVPVTLIVMFWVVGRLTARIQTGNSQQQTEVTEEQDSGTQS